MNDVFKKKDMLWGLWHQNLDKQLITSLKIKRLKSKTLFVRGKFNEMWKYLKKAEST